MKHFLLFVTLIPLLLTGFCNAQTNNDTLPEEIYSKGKVQLNIFFSPDYCDQEYKPVYYQDSNYGMETRRQAADTMNSITNSGFGYSFGADIICAFNNRLGLKTGIYFSMKIKRYNGFICRNGVEPSTPVFHLPNYEKEQVAYLELPIALNYSITPNTLRKLHISSFAGGLLAVNCGTSEIKTSRFWLAPGPFPTTTDGFLVGNRKAFTIGYIGIITGVKADYMIGDRFAFSLSPVFKYLPLTWGLPKGKINYQQTREVLYSVGCAVGVTCYFK